MTTIANYRPSGHTVGAFQYDSQSPAEMRRLFERFGIVFDQTHQFAEVATMGEPEPSYYVAGAEMAVFTGRQMQSLSHGDWIVIYSTNPLEFGVWSHEAFSNFYEEVEVTWE